MLHAWTGVVLAGGRARRFGGRDKASLLVEGRRIIERQVDTFLALTPHVLIVANDASRYRDLGVPIVADVVAGVGPLGGLVTALECAPTEQVIVVACDMPFVDGTFLTHLAREGRDAEAAVPRTRDGWHPLCASYSRTCSGRFRRRIAEGHLGVIEALAEVSVREITPDELAGFDRAGRLLTNLNSEDDYRRLFT